MAAGDWKEMLYASQTGDLELLKYHIQRGVNPNYQHPELLTTPLIESIENKHVEITKFLLENGANPHLKAGFSNDTPLKVAQLQKNDAAIKLLKPYYKSFFQSLLFWKKEKKQ
ncbi:ankyrin repeat domain-containing protein [Aureispira anguillae]|uniref:Ankyrin repeat domain-containing protein n=1 Tax=Aureispira anguillae TaxID=2864201 RepID=A0A916DSW8_9BACT|nr:ankyrin repeat domain-containing protein [Aureispira anguillae]BDS12804.1 ankyrin repeat domain-containing protein [Aureispira anguillae]